MFDKWFACGQLLAILIIIRVIHFMFLKTNPAAGDVSLSEDCG